MKKKITTTILLSVLLCVSCGCDGNGGGGYDPSAEMAQMRNLVQQYRPDIIGEPDPYQKIILFRDHIHWVTLVYSEPLVLPFLADYYKQTVEQERGNLCQGMSMHLAAFLQAFGYKFRHVELWTGETVNNVPVTHSVIEVFIRDKWEMHDTTSNCVLVLDGGKPLDVMEIKQAIETGQNPIRDTQGFDQRGDCGFCTISDDEYYEYFNTIKYTFSAVFY
jgi:hypothetical protein